MSEKYFNSKYGTVYQIFKYKEGRLYWNKNTSFMNLIGKEAESIDSRGYYTVSFNNKKVLAHRLIFSMFHGYLPELVDHIDGNKLNNNICNLRAATKSENQQNTKITKRNTSGEKSIIWRKDTNKWRVRIRSNNVIYDGGSYFDKNQAIKIARDLREKLHGKFARHK
jgi:hypothetical protein